MPNVFDKNQGILSGTTGYTGYPASPAMTMPPGSLVTPSTVRQVRGTYASQQRSQASATRSALRVYSNLGAG